MMSESPSTQSITPVSVKTSSLWIGRILGGLPALLLLMGGVMNLVKPTFVVEGVQKMGYGEHVILPLGIVLIVSTLLYLTPKTSALGAIILTGYLGGAVATHVRAGDGLVEILFPVVFGALLWSGLLLTTPRLRQLLPVQAN
jgi:DoxX-like family